MQVQNCHIVPALIDIDKFVVALSKTLSVMPTFAGRAKNEGQDWWVGTFFLHRSIMADHLTFILD